MMKNKEFEKYVMWKYAKVMRELSDCGYNSDKEEVKDECFKKMAVLANFTLELLGCDYLEDVDDVYRDSLDHMDLGCEGGEI